jgi:hypothetical protein
MELVLTMIERSDGGTVHLTPGDVARFVEKRATADERRTIERHLNECDACRTEIIQVARFARGGGARRRVFVAVPVAAAAALLVWVAVGPSAGGVDPNRLRAGSEGLQRIEAVTPVDERVVRTDTVSFLWRSAGPGAQYSINITDTRGDPVSQALVADSVFVITIDALRGHGAVFFWYVDAVLPDGSTASTRVRRFSLSP